MKDSYHLIVPKVGQIFTPKAPALANNYHTVPTNKTSKLFSNLT
jgi:hypothetical protein